VPNAPSNSSMGNVSTDGASDGSRCVLVVEDHEDSLRLMQRLLSTLGYEPLLAGDGASGLITARARKPAVALVDLGLPGDMDGFAVARQLRAEFGATVRLVALTGQDEVFLEEGGDAGFERHLQKPVLPERLIAILSEFIGPPTEPSAGGKPPAGG
jgi:CheY-like chemotaxis protein